MIVPMKKAFVLARTDDAAAIVDRMRSLGILHVEHQNAPKSKDTEGILRDIESAEKAINILSSPEFKGKRDADSDVQAASKCDALHVVDLYNRFHHLQDYCSSLGRYISEWQTWGDFDPDAIAELQSRGIYIKLFRIPAGGIKRFPTGVIVRTVSKKGGMLNCVAISREDVEYPFKPVELPKEGLTELEDRFDESSQTLSYVKQQISTKGACLVELKDQLASLHKELEFHEALRGMGSSGKVAYLTGYIPQDAAGDLIKTAKEKNWAVAIREPSDDDKVPTLIRNPRWISMIEPVFRALDIMPGYRELDMSIWFLIFLSVFFGMLIGDAAYGALFLGITFWAHKKFGPRLKSRSIFALFYVLSLCAVIWGVLTGTFFGQAWLPASIKPLMPALRDDKILQTICFLLGAFHLSIAHTWKALRKMPSLAAMADIGWISILCGAYFLARTLILGEPFPAAAAWLFAGGSLSVVFFTAPQKNILRCIGSGAGSLLQNIVNSFTDVVSYIRLFAVGLATVAIADAFNSMAMGIGFKGVLSSLATAAILILGHTLNIVLGQLSIVVHGVRLNVLEFSNHIDVTWNGFSYNPLKK